MKEVKEIYIPFYTEKFEKIVQANNGYLALGRVRIYIYANKNSINSCMIFYINTLFQLTWADFVLTGLIESMGYISESNFLEDFPGLKNVFENVTTLPKVQEWVTKRPKTNF